jgi:amino acid transporter
VTTLTEHDDDAVLPRFGYGQQFVRSLRHFESFAVAFSFISITTGIFTTFAFALGTGGPRSIWTWPIVVVGQTLVALVYGALAARVPLSGYSYQWASRLANVHVGWWLGWMSFAFLSIVTVSVDYGLVQVAFQPLIGEAYTPTSAALETLVVLVLQAALAARVPLCPATPTSGPPGWPTHVGWWLGWMSFAFLSIVTVSVDYGLVQVAFQPLIGQAYTPTSAALETLVVLALQAALIIWSTRITTRVNNRRRDRADRDPRPDRAADRVAAIRARALVQPDLDRDSSRPRATTPARPVHAGDAARRLHHRRLRSRPATWPRRPGAAPGHPRAMVRAVVASGVVGMAFLIALAYSISNIGAVKEQRAGRVHRQRRARRRRAEALPHLRRHLDLACGLIIMVTNSLLIWSMSRDRRLPGYQLWRQVPRPTGGPSWATILAAVIGAVITPRPARIPALVTLFTAVDDHACAVVRSTVLLYIFTGRRRRGARAYFSLGRWEIPVIAGAVDLARLRGLVILIGSSEFRYDAQYYVLGAPGLGLLFYIGQWLLEPSAMRTEEGAHGAEAREVAGQPAAAGPGGPLTGDRRRSRRDGGPA